MSKPKATRLYPHLRSPKSAGEHLFKVLDAAITDAPERSTEIFKLLIIEFRLERAAFERRVSIGRSAAAAGYRAIGPASQALREELGETCFASRETFEARLEQVLASGTQAERSAAAQYKSVQKLFMSADSMGVPWQKLRPVRGRPPLRGWRTHVARRLLSLATSAGIARIMQHGVFAALEVAAGFTMTGNISSFVRAWEYALRRARAELNRGPE